MLTSFLTFVCEAKAAQEQQAVVQPGEQREAAAERVVPEEQLEHGGLLVPAGPPVRVRHGELVQVRQQRGDPLPDRPLHGPACAAGRRCHVTQDLLLGSLEPRSLGHGVPQSPADCFTVDEGEANTPKHGSTWCVLDKLCCCSSVM